MKGSVVTRSRRSLALGFSLVVVAAAMVATAPSAAATPSSPAITDPDGFAANQVAALVNSRPAYLFASDNETFVQGAAIASGGRRYIPFQRKYGSLPVVGGDFVMVTNSAGQNVASSVAMTKPIGDLSLTPSLTSAAAEAVATKQLGSVSKIEGTQLVVNALGDSPRLTWESTIQGTGAE